jgi:hypothetical protein
MGFFERVKRIIRVSTAIRGGTDAQGTIVEISKNTALRGSNTWMLVCSALLASIGLDVNSTAVIIGAMLISPLMSPILGVGLGIAIEDRERDSGRRDRHRTHAAALYRRVWARKVEFVGLFRGFLPVFHKRRVHSACDLFDLSLAPLSESRRGR